MIEDKQTISLGGLKIYVEGRQYPDAQDYWDGNWLNVSAEYQSGTSRVAAFGPIIHLSELTHFVTQVEKLRETLEGEARLNPIEPNLSITIVAARRGTINVTVSITPDHLVETHQFKQELDQSYLPELINSCRGILRDYPIKEPNKAPGSTV